ncbi:MAG: glycosyltransferase family protein [Alphaproteobacteria bacterium]
MTPKPALLFYCQHSLGMGHLVRSFSLARALAETFRVVVLNGGRLPDGIRVPDGVEIVQLPPLGMGTDGTLFSHDERYSVDEARALRGKAILKAFSTVAPEVLLIELFPFGRKRFAEEIVALLEAARRRGTDRPLTLCSLRDILVNRREKQQRYDDRASGLVNRYFDGVFVHSDPRFARLDESFHPRRPLIVPVYHTGFVLPVRRDVASGKRRTRVVVSAGGGIVGAPLFRAAVAAQRRLWEARRIPVTVIAGPFLPEEAWNELCDAAKTRPGLEIRRSVPDMAAEMCDATVSVSQCGYNTAMDILHAGISGLVVPFAEGCEDEQTNRARRLEKLGLVRVLDPERLDGKTLANEIDATENFRPHEARLDLDGAGNTARLIGRLLATRRTTAPSVRRTA